MLEVSGLSAYGRALADRRKRGSRADARTSEGQTDAASESGHSDPSVILDLSDEARALMAAQMRGGTDPAT